MALVPSLSVLLFHTLRWRAKAPWEQPPRGFNIPAALITKTEGTACLSLTDLAENRYIFPQFSCQSSYPDLAIGAKEILDEVARGILSEGQPEELCAGRRVRDLIYPDENEHLPD
jgi:hypothetical protein